MTDHFTQAEKLLAETECLDPTLPFVTHKVGRAGVHAQLAIVQAFLGSCDCGIANDYPMPWKPEVTVTPREGFL